MGTEAALDVIERELRRQFLGVRAEILGEFFAKAGAQGAIISVAREYEAAAYATAVPYPGELSVPAQTVIGALADHFGRDRKQVLIVRMVPTGIAAGMKGEDVVKP